VRVISAFCRAQRRISLEGQAASTPDSVRSAKEETSKTSLALPCFALEEAVEVGLVQSAASGQPQRSLTPHNGDGLQILARIATFLPALEPKHPM
jgi:hypothetical protein